MFGRYVVGVGACAWLLAIAGCGGESSTKPRSDQPAGEVVEVSGTVTAELAANGETRSRRLAVGDKLLADETIITGADGEVTIWLFHNDARWTLGADKRRQLRQSAAWNAPKSGRDLLAGGGGDQTAVAGRHAEREAADTSATAMAPGAAAETATATEETRATGASDQPDSKAKRKQAGDDRARQAVELAKVLEKDGELAELGSGEGVVFDTLGAEDGTGAGGLGISGTGPGGGGTGEGTIGLGSVGTIGHGSGGGTGSGYGKGTGGAKTTSSKVVFGTTKATGLDPSVAKRVLRRQTAALRYCYEQKRQNEPALAGSLEAVVMVDAKGQVIQAKVTGDDGLEAAIGACVVARLRTLAFPAPPGGGVAQITTEIQFRAP